MKRTHRPSIIALTAALALAAFAGNASAQTTPIKILFVGDSYTFGRVDPVMSYNAANVTDLTAGFDAINSTGTNSYEPHPWGGVPGIFKEMTDEAGLNYAVSISARNAASLRGQFLDTANSTWDLRGNVASQDWGVVVLQDVSDESLPAGKGKNANNATFAAYANQFETYIHNGAAQSYKESTLFGSLAACEATGLSAGSCNTTRNIPANTNADPNTKVYLTETWARPDMVYAHLNTVADPNSPSGAPIVDTSTNPNGTPATLYYNSLSGMTADLHAAFAAELAANPKFAGVISVGDAFQSAFDQALVQTGGFYDANGVYVPPSANGAMDLWWIDGLHASVYGSYLDSLMQFGTITGLDPRSLGGNEKAASDLGISSADAVILEDVASAQLGFTAAAVPEPSTYAMLAGGLGLGLLALRRRQRR